MKIIYTHTYIYIYILVVKKVDISEIYIPFVFSFVSPKKTKDIYILEMSTFLKTSVYIEDITRWREDKIIDFYSPKSNCDGSELQYSNIAIQQDIGYNNLGK